MVAAEATQTATAAVLRAEKDLAKTGQKNRLGVSVSVATAAGVTYFFESSADIATRASFTAAGTYPAAVASTRTGVAYLSGNPTAVGAPAKRAISR